MNLRFAALVYFSLCLFQQGGKTCAADPKAADPDLPQPLDLNIASLLLESSPFTRALNLSESLALTGIAFVEGKPVATLTDKATKRSFLVSAEPNAQGWRLAEALPSTELKRTQVKIYVGAEIVTIRYGDAQITPSKGSNDAAKWRALSDKDIYRTDDQGKQYVRGSIYLPDADRERYYNGWSREAHDKFRQVIQDSREKMLQWSHEERAAFSKKVFDAIDRNEQSRAK